MTAERLNLADEESQLDELIASYLEAETTGHTLSSSSASRRNPGWPPGCWRR